MTAAPHVLEMRDVLLRMAARGATGTMIVQAEGRVLAVSFDQGEIVSADLNESFEEGLGPVMVAEGLMTVRQMGLPVLQNLRGLAQAVPRLRRDDLVTEPELQRGLRAYVSDLLLRLLRWQERDYQFYDSDSLEQIVRLSPISVEELLVRAADEAPGLLGGEVPALGRVSYRRVMGPNDMGVDSRSRRSSGAALTRLEERTLRLADGATPSSRYSMELGTDEFRVRFALYRLLEARLVEPFDEVLEPAHSGPGLGSEAAGSAGSAAAIDDLFQASNHGEGTLADLGRSRARHSAAARFEFERFFDGFSLVWSVALGVVAILLLIANVSVAPAARDWVLPFPWQERARQEMLARQWQATEIRLRRSLVAEYLKRGELPRELGRLVDGGLLTAADLYGPDGFWLSYRPVDGGYLIGSGEDDEVGDEELRTTAGDWVLDSSVLSAAQELLDRPLILLD